MGKYKPKLILLESNDTVREHASSILTREGWEVFSERVTKDALDRLEQSREYLFALFISNFKLHKIEGDNILQKVKSISPLTRRMLLVTSDRADILIGAINKAEINACITFPFKDEDLIHQAGNCLRQFKLALKKQRLKRVTAHQNKQMLRIAQKLKKKDDAYREIIEGKKTEKKKLKSELEKIEAQNPRDTEISLSRLLELRGIKTAPETFNNEFDAICKTLKELFNQVAVHHSSAPVDFDLTNILNPKKEEAQETLSENESADSDLISEILKETFWYSIGSTERNPENPSEYDNTRTEKVDHILDGYFEITVSESRTKAYIKKIKEFDDICPLPSVSDIQDLLKQKQIFYGTLDDAAIESWISRSFVDRIIIASGKKPVFGQNGKIKYYFQTDFTNPGKLNEDGTIDFRDRGEIPFVKKGELLARKTLPQAGTPGITVSGMQIPANEVSDPVLLAGPGTELSEDTLGIHAACDGQPHRDALGTLSVNPDLIIPGDVDFSTGNIDFKGNIIVKGMVREGFIVKGINLTANEIQGASIDLSGDLNVSAGIRASKISFHGNMYAKYLNHSIVKGFGNLTIQREIFGSDILLSGSCNNPTGHIISSQISAKLGIEAGKIGTPVSKPCKLKVGVDKHIETLKNEIDNMVETLVEKSKLLKIEIKTLEEQDQTLYEQISGRAYIQDRAQVEMKELKKTLPEIEKSNDITKLQETAKEINMLLEKAKAAEKELNKIFETQDKIANKIEQLKTEMGRIEEKRTARILEKKALTDFSKKDEPVAVLTVTRSITVYTLVKGPHASLTLKEDRNRCKIHELCITENDTQFHEMIISDL